MKRLPWRIFGVVAALSLASCGGESAKTPPAATAGPDPTVTTPTPTPSPAPTPEPTQGPLAIVGSNTAEGFPQLDPIPTNFSLSGMLRPSWDTGAIPALEHPSEGAFRFLCTPSHLAYDDPIVYPNQPGRAHLHMFFGNTRTDANSDFRSLRTTGESTCNNALNRSAYWVPALLNGRGKVVLPDTIAIYYKRWPQSHPYCQVKGRPCVGLPRGLRYVFGRTMEGKETTPTYFVCDAPGLNGKHHDNLALAAQNCPIGAKIGAVTIAGSCWDGKHLDVPDHRSHMSDVVYDKSTGNPRCPDTHPVRVPTFQIGVWYTVDETLDRTGNTSPDAQTWFFASDRMKGMMAMTPGTTYHADWFGAWDDDTMSTWLKNCIEKTLSCSGGDLGNGTQLSYSSAFLLARPRTMDTPKDPKG